MQSFLTIRRLRRHPAHYIALPLALPCFPDLSLRRTPSRHQRMPSHEAILKVAKQHKLPAPQLSPPQQQQVSAAVPVAPALRQQELAAPAAVGAAGTQGCMPVWRPAPAEGEGADAERQAAAAAGPASSEALRQQEAAEAVYGERWQDRKARVQLTSPHGRCAVGCGGLSFGREAGMHTASLQPIFSAASLPSPLPGCFFADATLCTHS